MKSSVAECVFESVTIVVDTRDSAGGCDSKTAHKYALFSCSDSSVGFVVGDELAVVESGWGCKTTLFGAARSYRLE